MKPFSKFFSLCAGFLFVLFAVYLHWKDSKHISPQQQSTLLQNALSLRAEKLEKLAKEFSTVTCGGFDAFLRYPEKWRTAAEQEEIALFKFDKENLLFWSDNTLPVGLEVLRSEPTNKLWKLKNGWYLAHRISSDSCSVLGLALIKREFSYSNKYLNDYFKDAPDVLPASRLSIDSIAGALALKNQSGTSLAYFEPSSNKLDPETKRLPTIFLFLSGVLLLVGFIHRRLKESAKPRRNLFLF